MKIRVLLAILSVALVGLLAPINVSAVPAPTAEQTVRSDQQLLRQQLVDRISDLGLTREEARTRVSKLTDDDVATLAANPEQLAMGGVKDRTLIIIAGIIILPSILLLLLI